VNCRGNNSFQNSLSGQSRYDDDYDYEMPTAQQILNKTIEYELRKMGDNISPLGGDR
jgi:hypothetical protein